MIKIISFDVGIKNLAYCVVSFNNSLDVYDHTIEDWGVIDIMEKFVGERGRINCSLKETMGFWRWLGIQFVISDN